MRYRPKHIAEYAALRGFQLAVNVLPYRLALLGGAGLAWIAYHLVRWRVAAAKRRIREVLGDATPPGEVNRIARSSMRYMFFNAIDILRAPLWNRARLDRLSDFHRIAAALKQHTSTGRGALCVMSHMGSWELAGLAGAVYGNPLFFIVGVQRNPLFNTLINNLRGATGFEMIPRDDPGLLRKVVRNLKDGKVLAMNSDLRSKTKGLAVQFLGKEANIVAGMGLFARQAMVPIMPVVCYREGWARHRCLFFDLIEPDRSLTKQEDWVRMTQQTLTIYEAEIRKRPDQYFWYNKRWILDPFIEEADAPSPDPQPPPDKSAP